MINRTIEIGGNNKYLYVKNGFIVIKDTDKDGDDVSQVAIDDVSSVIVTSSYGVSYSNSLLVRLSQKGIPLVVCGSNFSPSGVLWPTDGNFEQSRRINAQINAYKSTHKRAWASIVQAKLSQQAAVLRSVDVTSAPIERLIKQVKSGDPENLEAQAARKYWSLLFGGDFKRDQKQEGLNSLLNYGYAVLRSGMARSISSAGLHPSVGINHSNANNPFVLVDDLMEPFRPLVDFKVWLLQKEGKLEVDKDTKEELISLLYKDLDTPEGKSPVLTCMQRLATSLALKYIDKNLKLNIPPAPKKYYH